MQATNFLSDGTSSVNVPMGTSPDYIAMILQNLPSIFGMFGGSKPEPVKQPSLLENPYILLGGAALIVFLAKK